MMIRLGVILKAILHTILSVVCVTSVVTAAFLNSTLHIMFDQSTYEDLAANSHIREFGAGLVTSYIVSRATDPEGTGSFMSQYSVETWRQVAEELVPDTWVEESFRQIAGALRDWMRDAGPETPDLQLDISSIKERIESPLGNHAVLPLLQQAPLCQSGQSEIILFSEAGLINCIPPESDLSTYAEIVATTLAEQIPDRVNIVARGSALTQVRAYVWAVIMARNLGLTLGLLALGLIALINSSSTSSAFESIKVPVFSSAAVSIVAGGLFWLSIQLGQDLAPLTLLRQFDTPSRIVILELADIVGDKIASRWVSVSFILLFASSAVYAIGPITRKLRGHFSGEASTRTEKRLVRREFR